MGDLPLVLLTATIWTYWIGVGAMVVRLRRRMRKKVGLVPEQRAEQYMWMVWVPLVVAWNLLPWLALTRTHAPLGLPDFARQDALYAGLRWGAAIVAILSLAITVKCWTRMGKDWRMDVSVAEPTTLITDGAFAYIRHPIYAFSILLMLCTAAIVPTPPMAAVALIHILLMNLKARNEERHLLRAQGDAYARYLARTGRFFPRFGREPHAP
jgi:protein-S-isoprenylcysteine O-methyltransferase Ste14